MVYECAGTTSVVMATFLQFVLTSLLYDIFSVLLG